MRKILVMDGLIHLALSTPTGEASAMTSSALSSVTGHLAKVTLAGQRGSPRSRVKFNDFWGVGEVGTCNGYGARVRAVA
jgi:hypothetical protein